MAVWAIPAAYVALAAFGLAPEPPCSFAERMLDIGATGDVRRARVEEIEASGTFHGVGVVTAIDSGSGALTLDHDDIPGLMPAMVMMYRVASPDLDRGLAVGDRVAFDIDGGSLTISAVRKLGPAK